MLVDLKEKGLQSGVNNIIFALWSLAIESLIGLMFSHILHVYDILPLGNSPGADGSNLGARRMAPTSGNPKFIGFSVSTLRLYFDFTSAYF